MSTKFSKIQSKLALEASKKATRFSKAVAAKTDHLCGKKVANHPGTDNSYGRPEKKYDIK